VLYHDRNTTSLNSTLLASQHHLLSLYCHFQLKDLRNKRWEKAFSAGTEDSESTRDTINRKATIVIEHLIQASDVAHTMQVSNSCVPRLLVDLRLAN
jgi:hypothetical protein